MSIRERIPGDRGDGATQDVASLLAAIALTAIEPFGSDNPELSGLPKLPEFPAPEPLPATQLSVAQCAYNTGMISLGTVKRIEDAVAGLKARLVARVVGAAAVEAELVELDSWQDGVAASSTATEMALMLGIPEGSATALEHHSVVLVKERPQVLEALESGELSWRHATIINDEIRTLQETANTTPEDVAVLEARLLVLSENTTAASFVGRARRAREKMFPETITTRTKEAFTRRKITCDAGKDGMSWLTLHLPTVTASAIYTRCTRLARAIKADAAHAQHEADSPGAAAGTAADGREHRTLDQLRTDIAAILLLGQDFPTATTPTPPVSTPTATDSEADSARTGDGANRPASEEGPEAGRNTPATTGPPWDWEPVEGEEYVAAPWDKTSPCQGPDDSPDESPGHDDDPGRDFAGTAAPCTADPEEMTAEAAGAGNAPGQAAEGAGACGNVAPDQVSGDGSGLVGWTVDGIAEHPQAEYLEQLRALARSRIMIDPPLSEALIIVTVPFLGLLGITDEPAELVGPQGGPVPEDLARKLLGNSATFLRVLTDPVTGAALPLEPQRYTLRTAERAVLQALSGGCYVPNCQNPVMDTELDHLRAFEVGGKSTMANLRATCRRHHTMKHFKDDKDRHGQRRSINEPERQGIKLRGWTAKVTDDGRVGWITPSGRYQPPQNNDPQRPRYPKWLKKLIQKSLNVTMKPGSKKPGN